MKHSAYTPSRIEVYVSPGLGGMIRFAPDYVDRGCTKYSLSSFSVARWPCITGDLEISSKPPKAREVHHTYAGSAHVLEVLDEA